MEIALKPEDQELIEKHVASGRFKSIEEAVGALVRMLPDPDDPTPEEEWELLRPALEGYDRGEYRTLKTRADYDELYREITGRERPKRVQGESE